MVESLHVEFGQLTTKSCLSSELDEDFAIYKEISVVVFRMLTHFCFNFISNSACSSYETSKLELKFFDEAKCLTRRFFCGCFYASNSFTDMLLSASTMFLKVTMMQWLNHSS